MKHFSTQEMTLLKDLVNQFLSSEGVQVDNMTVESGIIHISSMVRNSDNKVVFDLSFTLLYEDKSKRWTTSVDINCLLPHHIPPVLLYEVDRVTNGASRVLGSVIFAIYKKHAIYRITNPDAVMFKFVMGAIDLVHVVGNNHLEKLSVNYREMEHCKRYQAGPFTITPLIMEHLR